MSVETSVFGKCPDGKDILLYTISNSKGMQAAVTNVGAALVKLLVPDREGKIADVVLGFDKGEDYLVNGSLFGATVGPCANRTGNAKFELDGVTYQMDVNDGVNNLHTHLDKGYHKLWWDSKADDNSVTFTLEDQDGNLGMPGNRKITVTYRLDEENALTIQYHGISDKRTVLNLTNHTYFNLDGHESGKVAEHKIWLGASRYTPVRPGAIPTGDIAPVAGTPMDFMQFKVVGKDIDAEFDQLKMCGGYDHNWVIDDWDGSLRHFATVEAPKSGRIMKAYTTLPGVQFYTGNSISPQTGKGGQEYSARSGLCLETQYFPDSANKPQFPSCIFGEGKEYESVTVYKFE